MAAKGGRSDVIILNYSVYSASERSYSGVIPFILIPERGQSNAPFKKILACLLFLLGSYAKETEPRIILKMSF